MESATFVCEQCKQPLKVTDSVLQTVDSSAQDTKAASELPHSSSTKKQSPFTQNVDFNAQSAPDASYMILSPAPHDIVQGAHDVKSKTEWSDRVRSLSQYYDQLSTDTQIPFPLCRDCVEQCEHQLKRQNDELQQELDAYEEYCGTVAPIVDN